MRRRLRPWRPQTRRTRRIDWPAGRRAVTAGTGAARLARSDTRRSGDKHIVWTLIFFSEHLNLSTPRTCLARFFPAMRGYTRYACDTTHTYFESFCKRFLTVDYMS